MRVLGKRPFVPIELGGRRGRALLDTGLQGTLLLAEGAARTLELSEAPFDERLAFASVGWPVEAMTMDEGPGEGEAHPRLEVAAFLRRVVAGDEVTVARERDGIWVDVPLPGGLTAEEAR